MSQLHLTQIEHFCAITFPNSLIRKFSTVDAAVFSTGLIHRPKFPQPEPPQSNKRKNSARES
jgi:hypothetical protein